MRSLLTVLGIVIGVAAVIIDGHHRRRGDREGDRRYRESRQQPHDVRPGKGPGPGRGERERSQFKIEDAEAIAREISGLAAVAPAASQTMQAIAGSANWSTTVTGTTNGYLQVQNGNSPAAASSARRSSGGGTHCILGDTVRTQLFGSQDPLGAIVRLQKLSCQVIAVLAKKGQSSFGMDRDDVILVPLRMLQRRVAGNVDVSMISVSARDGVSTEKVQRDIERLLRERRRIGPGKDDDFHVRNMQQLIKHLGGNDPGSDGAARGGGRGESAGGRDRHHEHHAGVGDRADAGNRDPAGHRRFGAGGADCSFWWRRWCCRPSAA